MPRKHVQPALDGGKLWASSSGHFILQERALGTSLLRL